MSERLPEEDGWLRLRLRFWGTTYQFIRFTFGIFRLELLEIILSLVQVGSAVVVVYVPFWLKAQTLPNVFGLPPWGWLLVAVVLRFLSQGISRIKADRTRRSELRKRKVISAQALEEIATVIRMKEQLPPDWSIDRWHQKILQAICSHTEQHIRGLGKSGALTACLMKLEGEELVVVARFGEGGATRQPRKRRRARELFCGKALEHQKTISAGDLAMRQPDRTEERPYRDILALPLLGAGGAAPHVGVVTVDSPLPFVFWGKEKSLKVGLSPYYELLKLSLVLQGDPQSV